MNHFSAVLIGFLVLGWSNTGRAELEFVGYIEIEKDARFVLRDSDERKTSGWLSLGQSFQAHTVIAFDKEKETLAIEKSGVNLQLPLKRSRVREDKERLSQFRDLFREKDVTITVNDVEAQLGPPSRVGPAVLDGKPFPLTRETSTWVYLLGPGEHVNIHLFEGRVALAYRIYRDDKGQIAREVLRNF